jgi:hypothetical protein
VATCSSAEFGEWEIQEPEPEEKEFEVGAKVRFMIFGIEPDQAYSLCVAKVGNIPCEGVLTEAMGGLGPGMWEVRPINMQSRLRYMRHEDNMELI